MMMGARGGGARCGVTWAVGARVQRGVGRVRGRALLPVAPVRGCPGLSERGLVDSWVPERVRAGAGCGSVG